MRIVWTPKAVKQFASIIETIAADNKSAAGKFRDRILKLVNMTFIDTPLIGKPGRVTNTREFVVHPSYILVYRVKNGLIQIISLRHSARLWPKGFKD